MTREEKALIVSSLSEKLQQNAHYYLIDISGFNAQQTADLRKECNEKDIVLTVVKNTLFRAALQENGINVDEVVECLNGPSAVMFTNVGNSPAKLIAGIRKGKDEKPALKAAWVEECLYVGDENLSVLENIKSREELIGDIVGLLQSPIKNVVSALQSGGHILSGVIKTLEERNQ